MAERISTKKCSEWYIGTPSNACSSEMDFNLHFKIPFGYSAQNYEKTLDVITELIFGAICLRPTYIIPGE